MTHSSSDAQEYNSRFDLRAILETSHLLAESRDSDFILNNLLLISMGKLLITQGLILMYEPNDNSYRVVKSKGKAAMPEGETVVLNILMKLSADRL